MSRPKAQPRRSNFERPRGLEVWPAAGWGAWGGWEWRVWAELGGQHGHSDTFEGAVAEAGDELSAVIDRAEAA